MKKSIKDRWLAALRSKEYKQGKNRLRQRPPRARKDRFCCLGVLCDIIDPSKWAIAEEGCYPYQFSKNEHRTALLQDSMLLKTGLDDSDQQILCSMNDKGATFQEIADYIEENL